MSFFKNLAIRGLSTGVGAIAGAIVGPEASPVAYNAANAILSSDVVGNLASKGIKAVINHQFSFGHKKMSPRDIINKIKGLPENIVQKLPSQYQDVGRGIAKVLANDVNSVLMSNNPLQAGKDLYKEAKNINMYAHKLGLHDALGRVSKDLWKPTGMQMIGNLS